LKVLLGVLVAIVASAPAFAFLLGDHYRHLVPAPAPALAVGGPAVLAVIAAYVIARLVIRRSTPPKSPTS
jgi:hypothetical protein